MRLWYDKEKRTRCPYNNIQQLSTGIGGLHVYNLQVKHLRPYSVPYGCMHSLCSLRSKRLDVCAQLHACLQMIMFELESFEF